MQRRPYVDTAITPAMGGKLATDISQQTVGIADYVTKRDFRRYLDRERRREGHDYWQFDELKSLNADGAITLKFRATSVNGLRATIAGTPTTLYRYFDPGDGGPFYYWDRSDPNYPYVDPADPNSPYVNEATAAGWIVIGSGFSTSGNRWEAIQVGNEMVFNNGVDLPVSYKLSEFAVTPLYELREQGVAALGTIVGFSSVLMGADVAQIKTDKIPTIFDNIPFVGNGYQTGAQYSGLSLATQAAASLLVNITAGPFVFTAGMVGKTLRFRNGFSRVITAYGSPTQVTLAAAAPTVANTDQTFFILNIGNIDKTVFSAGNEFTSDMVGLNLYWTSGESRLITAFVNSNQVLTNTDYPVPLGPFALENRKAYASITDESVIDRIRYRELWSALGQPSRFAAEIPASMETGSNVVHLEFPVRSFANGQKVIVLGAGTNGANLVANIIFVLPGSASLLLDAPATATTELVTAAMIYKFPESPSVDLVVVGPNVTEDTPGETYKVTLGANDDYLLNGATHVTDGNFVAVSNKVTLYGKTPPPSVPSGLAYSGGSPPSIIYTVVPGDSYVFHRAKNDNYLSNGSVNLIRGPFTALSNKVTIVGLDGDAQVTATLTHESDNVELVQAGDTYSAGDRATAAVNNLVVGETYLFTPSVNDHHVLNGAIEITSGSFVASQSYVTLFANFPTLVPVPPPIITYSPYRITPVYTVIISKDPVPVTATLQQTTAKVTASVKHISINNTLVQAADMLGSIVGFDDLEQDGSRIIRMLGLNNQLVIYRETGYSLAVYNPTFDASTGQLIQAFQFSPMIETANTLFYKYSLINVTHQGTNFHLFAGQNDFFRFDMIARVPIEFTPLQLCRKTFFDEAAKGETLDMRGPNLLEGLTYDNYVNFLDLLVVGTEYVYEGGANETLAVNGSLNLSTAPAVQFTATETNINIYVGSLHLPSTARLYTPGYTGRRTDIIFTAENTLTKEIFLCFPSEGLDKALVFDYDQGTVSTSAAWYTAAAMVNVFDQPDLIFAMGTADGKALTYGLSRTVVVAWNGSAMFNRLGQAYTSQIDSGLGAFGSGYNERTIKNYVLLLASFLADVPVAVSLYGARNPSAAKRLLATKTFPTPSLENVLPIHDLAYYFADRIVVSGKDNPFEISGRIFDIAAVHSESVTKLK